MEEAMKLVAGLRVHKGEQGYILVHPETASWVFLDTDALSILEPYIENPETEMANVPPEALESLQEAGLVREKNTGGRPEKESLRVHIDNAIIRITHRCNLTCDYCYATSPRETVDLKPEYGKLLVDRLLEMPQDETAIQFHGGEPLLVFDLVRELSRYGKEVAYSKGKDLTLVIQTNATLLNRERTEFLRKHDFEVGVSLDGEKATNDLYRRTTGGLGSFDLAMKGIRLLRDERIPIGVNCVVTRKGLKSLVPNVEFLSENVSQHIKFTPVYLQRNHPSYHELVPDYHEFYSAMRDLLEYMVQTGLSKKVHLIDVDHLLINCLTTRRPYMCLRMPCGAGLNQIAVDARGDLFPCDAVVGIPTFRLANIAEVTDVHLLLLQKWVSHHVAKDFEHLNECCSCNWREFCGHCVASAYYAYGDQNRKRGQCEYYKAMIPYLIERIALDDRFREFRWAEV